MAAYLIRRLILIFPTLFGIIAINFVIIQFAPGGPVEQMIAELKGKGALSSRLGSASSDIGSSGAYRGSQGLDPQIIADIKKMFGFDKPPLTRFTEMLKGYLRFDFGQSFFRDKSVVGLIFEKLPVSLSLGLWSTVLIYMISIPLGIRKAVRNGSRFDVATSAIVLVGYALPGFLLAIMLVVLFAGGSFLSLFPLSGMTSQGSALWSWPSRVLDYLWHMVLPITAMVAGGFASLTMLTKNCFLEEIGKQYTVTARAKGASENRVLCRSCFPQRDVADRGRISTGLRRHPVHLGVAGGNRVFA